jgi:hypothetical protein
MHLINSRFLDAFPAALRDDAFLAVSALPEDPYPRMTSTFTVRVADELVALPQRIYHDPARIHFAQLNSLQRELANCLLTRHNDGFVRQHYLSQVIRSRHIWVPPFVLQLVGEYVVEILQVIHHNLSSLDKPIYEQFLAANPDFLALTEQRVISYWNCYYRCFKRDEYVGFQLLTFFKSLVGKSR